VPYNATTELCLPIQAGVSASWLASENLSATEAVHITEAKGISLISDIDDIIASGAKEIFTNTFIRELQDLTIQGVKEWYTKLYSLGVKLHYVSNSP